MNDISDLSSIINSITASIKEKQNSTEDSYAYHTT